MPRSLPAIASASRSRRRRGEPYLALSLPRAEQPDRLVGEPGETLAATLRRTLLEMILFGGIDRGTRLYPQELAGRFGVSLTPVKRPSGRA